MAKAKNAANATVDTTSSDYDCSLPYWQMVRTMMKGTKAMRAAGELYLPRFDTEDVLQYRSRLKNARYTNIFADIVKNLADRPFAKEPAIKAVPVLEKMMENLDGQNNHASLVMADYFKQAITTGIHWAFVDYQQANPYVTDASGQQRRRSVVEEREAGARPYVILVRPEDLIAVYSAMQAGVEIIVHARIRECFKVRDGWNEVEVEQIRVLNRDPLFSVDPETGQETVTGYAPATYSLWERRSGKDWTVIKEGEIFIGEIALVPLIIGERTTGWQVDAEMADAAWLQLEYYEQENGLKNIKTLTAFPMLSASGVNPPPLDPVTKKREKVPVGPRAVLFGGAPIQGATQGGSWAWIEPAGTSLTFLKEDLKELAKEIRELGRQPLTASSSNITKETSAFAYAKGRSAIRRWSGFLKDAMENILLYMAKWEGIVAEPEVTMNLDDVDEADGDTGMTDLGGMFDKGLISKKTYREEAMRRNILSDNFDPDKEDAQIIKEMNDDPSLEDDRDALGRGTQSPEDEGEETSPDPDNDPPSPEDEGA